MIALIIGQGLILIIFMIKSFRTELESSYENVIKEIEKEHKEIEMC